MLPSRAVTAILVISLALFFLRGWYEGRRLPHEDEREQVDLTPRIALGLIGLASWLLISLAYIVLFLIGQQTLLTGQPLQLRFEGDTDVQILGALILVDAFLLLFWSLRTLDDNRLVRRGPYRWVRHPMYLGYFLIFVGFFLLLLNLIALLPLLALPGLTAVADLEEEYLLGRYGDEYLNYQDQAGKYLPRF